MTSNLQLITNSLPVALGNEDSYLQATHQLPVLSQEEEFELAHDLRENNNLAAAQTLILHNLRFVIKIARGYTGYGLPLPDLIQEGNIGLMKAVKRFDPSLKVRLVSFAVHWIRAEIHEYILRNWRIVKIATTKSQRKLFFNLRSKKRRFGWLNQEEVREVAKELRVKPEEVTEMEARLSNYDQGFDNPIAENDESNQTAPVAFLTHEDDDPAQTLEASDWSEFNQQKLSDALSQLDDRSTDILRSRWLSEKKETLHALAEKYQVSAERIRQLEKNAMKKLRVAISES